MKESNRSGATFADRLGSSIEERIAACCILLKRSDAKCSFLSRVVHSFRSETRVTAAALLAADADQVVCSKQRASTEADGLHAITILTDSTASSAIFKDSLSFSTELSLHRQRRARGSEATGREVSHGLTAKTANIRFTVLRPWYGLSTLSMRTLGYALGRSGSARRDLHGQAPDSSLYDRSDL